MRRICDDEITQNPASECNIQRLPVRETLHKGRLPKQVTVLKTSSFKRRVKGMILGTH